MNNNSLSAALLLGVAMSGLPLFGFGRSSQVERYDPDRPKTADDLEALAAAQEKRDRRAAKRERDIRRSRGDDAQLDP